MGTPIAGKPHTSPLVGTEKVPLSPDGFATTGEIAGLATGGGLSHTVTLNATALRALLSTPAEIVPAPGAGNILVPHSVMMRFTFGTKIYGPFSGALILSLVAGRPVKWLFNGVDSLPDDIITSDEDSFAASPLAGPFALGAAPDRVSSVEVVDIANLPLFLTANQDYLGGVPTATSINAAGSDYAPGDTLVAIALYYGTKMAVTVNTVSGGAVTGYSVTDFGTLAVLVGDTFTFVGTSPQAGIGGGFILDVDAIDSPGDGTLEVTTSYSIA